MRVDIHQHLWPEPLLAALARRERPPQLVRDGRGWAIRVPGEPQSPVMLRDHDPDVRAARVRRDGLDRAIIAPSTPLGIEALPADEAAPLLEAYHAGVMALPVEFGAWAAIGLAEPDPAGLAALLDRGFVGATLAADALRNPHELERLASVLAALESRDAPLFVHPGPTPRTVEREVEPAAPDWWPALTRYVSGMNSAWHGFVAFGRAVHPGLRVCFAMLAGLAPLHRERLLARGSVAVSDPGMFLETSSYGVRAVDAVIRELGVDSLVYGSDRPVIATAEPALGEAVRVALFERNPLRLMPSMFKENNA